MPERRGEQELPAKVPQARGIDAVYGLERDHVPAQPVIRPVDRTLPALAQLLLDFIAVPIRQLPKGLGDGRIGQGSGDRNEG